MTVARVLAQALLLALLPLLLLGVIQRTRARLAGRRGAPLLQPWYDLARLLAKGSVFSTTTTWVFRAGPAVGLAALLVAATLVPVGAGPALLRFQGDLILFLYLLALARFATILAALDTGSSFEGMGAAREATFAALAEPALFLALAALVRRSGMLSLSDMLSGAVRDAGSSAAAALVLVTVSLLVVLLAECARVPFDDPATHLELTMIHEVMVLDHSGPGLALVLYAHALKLLLFSALIARLVMAGVGAPAAADGPGWWLGLLLFAALLLLIAVAIGIIESVLARLRLVEVPRLLVAASILSAFAILLQGR